MRSKFISAFAVIGAVTVLVLAANTVALATTGKAILAGKSNTANAATGITRTTVGPALSVKTKSNANAPFAVNGTGKVANLNVDKVDGLDSTQLKTASYVMTKAVPSGSPVTSINIPITLPPGGYLMDYSVLMLGGAAAGVTACFFTHGGSSFYDFGEERATATTSANPAFSGSGYVTMGAGDTLSLTCSAPAAWYTLSSEPIQIVATPSRLISTKVLTKQSAARATAK